MYNYRHGTIRILYLDLARFTSRTTASQRIQKTPHSRTEASSLETPRSRIEAIVTCKTNGLAWFSVVVLIHTWGCVVFEASPVKVGPRSHPELLDSDDFVMEAPYVLSATFTPRRRRPSSTADALPSLTADAREIKCLAS